jgi:ketosteroid isomerase-like protein
MTASDIQRTLQQWTDAERTGDRDALDALLADDFAGIGPVGFVLTKTAWLDRLGPDLRYEQLDLDEISSRTYGDTTIVIGHQHAAGEARGNPLPPDTRVSFVIARVDDAGQRIAGIHYSFMAPAPGGGQ